jgi:phosphoglycerate dehydrogenase-like enzyme
VAQLSIATPLETALVERIAENLPGYDVWHAPDLLPPVRYPCDHRGDPAFRRGAEQQRHWSTMLGRSDIAFGIPGDDPAGLRELVDLAPGLRLVQATAAGAGQQVAAAGLSERQLERIAVASSSGVHAGPLAEFAVLGVLAFTRGLPRLERDRAARRWDHYATGDLEGRTAVVLGIGAIGSRVAGLAAAFGMRVLGINTTGVAPPDSPLDEVGSVDRLGELAAGADVLVITLPDTPATAALVDDAVLGSLAPGAVVVNVGRGKVVDERALISLLRSGHLGGAALDVTAAEPPPPDSPLWELPDVILSPHTAALSPRENERIVDLFIDNVRRLDAGRPIRNRITADRRY